MIRFYQMCGCLDDIDLDYRIKSEDSCLRKYKKYYPEMRVEKTFNDILGFRMLVDNYDFLANGQIPEDFRLVNMLSGKAGDDGYRGVHIYYQPDHLHYPVEIQVNSYYDRQFNNWLHKFLYKKGYPDAIGNQLRQKYECGIIRGEQEFKEVLDHVLSGCEKI